ncbi:WD40 protein [Dunaliella salina]|uniref:WD40 protein n=1 Tax=Dunaliella salina TaxID=3046 RepID=A0ABQ7GWD2_DUNSA|nr:WD40 protein [Dunaliella salina]|eukprot:KAF5838918.1 WD40 protein [Dunaliella salina]
MLATASADKTVKVWRTDTGELLQTLQGHAQGISDVAWTMAENYLCTASDDHTLKLWDVQTGRCLRTLTGHTNFVFCCCFSPQGHLVASGSFDETLRVWDVRTGHCLREVPAHSDPLTAVSFNYDGTLLVSSSLDGLCRIWDTQTGHCLKTLFDKQSPPVSSVRFSPNGRYILSSSLDGKIRLWDFEKGQAVRFYQGHINKQFCAFSAFSGPKGAPQPISKAKVEGGLPATWVVTGSEDGSIHVYGLNSEQALQVIDTKAGTCSNTEGAAKDDNNETVVLCVDAHPTLPILASCGHGQDGSVKLWEHQQQ